MTLDRHNHNIPEKANRILNVILVAMLLIVLRIWHLAVIQHDQKVEESRRPQRRTILEPARRATIRDRFNIPLAMNKIQYNAAVLYSQIQQIPSVKWEFEGGKKVKKFKRKEYIANLAKMLGDELHLDAERIEDLIHAKASFYSKMPFVIKENLAEAEYYRLKMLEKDWPGITMQRIPKRHYPLGKVGADVIGYLGAINKEEYEKILQEIRTLEAFVEAAGDEGPEELPPGIANLGQARKRLMDLKEYAYSLNDTVGKAGIEAYFEQYLRGFHGKKTFYSDARGNYLSELPGSRPFLSGQRLLLTISSELQEFAEKLLAQNERIREPKATSLQASSKQSSITLRQPWIKGGAIIALDPKNGEVLAMASYPRFDPNDFILSGSQERVKQKRSNVNHWLENELHISEIWNQARALEREGYNDRKEKFVDEKMVLTWGQYLHLILPKTSPVLEAITKIGTVGGAIDFQDAYSKDLDHEEKNLLLQPILANIPSQYEKTLLADLCRLAVDSSRFTKELKDAIGSQTLEEYRNACAAKVAVADAVKEMSKDLFHDIDFKAWRTQNAKEFLQQMRREEKAAKKSTRPYIEYLDAVENRLFKEFWENHGLSLINSFLRDDAEWDPGLQPYFEHFQKWRQEIVQGAHQSLPWHAAYMTLQRSIRKLNPKLSEEYLASLRGYQELIRPLLGRYRYLRKENGKQLEKHLASAFYPSRGFGYGRSQAYRQAASQGSIFKLVTSYAALIQRYQEMGSAATKSQLNPMEIIDHTHRRGKELFVGYEEDGKPLPRFYKGGRLPRSTHVIGKLDLVRAIETSSNPYFSLIAGEYLKDPEDLARTARVFSYGSKSGIDLPGEIAGKIPEDLSTNRTGLYSTAIGQHTLVVTPLQTALMLSAIANQGKVLKPKIVKMTVGKTPFRYQDLHKAISGYKYSGLLHNADIHFPLFTPRTCTKDPILNPIPTQVKTKAPMPGIIREMILDGMRRVVIRTQEESLTTLSRLYRDYPEAISDYIDLKHDLFGKTSTAESVENLDLDPLTGTNLYTHVWFGGISFSDEKYEEPELVVVIYLRFGGFGKEAAPMAAQMVKKWREIQEAHNKKGTRSLDS